MTKANYSFTLKTPAKPDNNESYPIYLLITLDRQLARYSTGLKVKLKEWDAVKKLPKNNASLAAELDKIMDEAKFNERCLIKEKRTYSSKDITSMLKGTHAVNMTFLEFFDDIIREIKTRAELSDKRISRYDLVRSEFERFLQTNKTGKNPLIKDITTRNITDFETFLLTVPKSEKVNPLGRNTVNSYLKIIKTILGRAQNEGVINQNPSYSVKLKQKATNRDYLTKEELTKLLNEDLKDNKLYDKVRDIFIFCSVTSLRINDALNLTVHNYFRDAEGDYIKWTQKKTGVDCSITLHPLAMKIIEKYAYFADRKVANLLLPKISEQVLNRVLKELAAKVGINKLLTAHVARHTFAVRFIEEGGSLEVLQSLMGHESIRTTSIYGKITKSRIDKESKIILDIA
jgi:site-specific recombinase XerD